MVKNAITKTQANILSSLHVSGVTATGGTDARNKIPVVGADGFLDVSLIPVDRVSADISIPRLAATAYVDPEAGKDKETGYDIPGYAPDGSIAKPFRTVSAAAAAKDSSGRGIFSNFILTPGEYADDDVSIASQATTVRLIGTGTVIYPGAIGLKFRNYANGTKIILFNVGVVSTLGLLSNTPSDLVLLGRGEFGHIQGTSGNADDDISSETFLRTLSLGPCVSVTRTTNVEAIARITTTDSIGNASSVAGITATDALARLDGRRIRIPVFSSGDTGILVTYEDVEVTKQASASYDRTSLEELGQTLAEAANAVFHKDGDDITVRDIIASGLSCQTVTAQTVKAGRFGLGDLHFYLDDDDCLVVGEEQS